MDAARSTIRYVETQETWEGIDPYLLDLFNHLEAMPAQLQDNLAILLIHGIQQIQKQQREQHLFDVRQVGRDRIKLYYQVRQLWPNVMEGSMMSRALKAAVILNQMGQTVFCFQFGEAISFVSLYLQGCRERRKRPLAHQVNLILQETLNVKPGDRVSLDDFF
jgi:hypothetical protein